MVRLGVNIDHVATVREARKDRQPDPVAAAIVAEMAGADGIVCHLREDRRHIKDKDLYLLKEMVKTHLNLEMAATDQMVKIALEVVPDMVTLVPERREEITTEGGLDVVKNQEYLEETIATLQNHNIIVSVFIDPDIQQVKAAARVRADYVEFHTGAYAHAESLNVINDELEKLRSLAAAAAKLRLGVSAGHGLNYQNVREVAAIPEIEELNIGHAIVGRAIMVGMERAVRDMLALIRG
ncbi:MAG: pyridoxine 5'-phosphate synthase [candidate division KSB1 bacterium]|nr:pyridoxine 5'-phosphate synthase [candidate division KSB1 bacterium]MDZ7274020.1 pyridoxine 5'-phosphate synthase [candidate division KSB1 bacterium]MDZ7286393.1 pyridoxine 5'-phosphate synthase [candidate division KSB1 bacterium]MDZ7296621.1 pyridoxine 5'-phosphate synthase [candidate division KSB1 bacterium]MDZ7306843.1 pyridoxine 5'-phosphate synthase [candidate division KSB1 bacterium]